MKTIFFIRHAKSSWADMSLRDIKRPLNKRGLRDAPFMAKLLKGKGVAIDAIVSSPANRAFTTATYFAEAFGMKVADIIIKKEIYEAYTEEILEVIRDLSDTIQTVLVFGHNPGFTSVANMFTEDYIANVPTCGITKIEADISTWKELEPEKGKLTAFYYPKQYF